MRKTTSLGRFKNTGTNLMALKSKSLVSLGQNLNDSDSSTNLEGLGKYLTGEPDYENAVSPNKKPGLTKQL